MGSSSLRNSPLIQEQPALGTGTALVTPASGVRTRSGTGLATDSGAGLATVSATAVPTDSPTGLTTSAAPGFPAQAAVVLPAGSVPSSGDTVAHPEVTIEGSGLAPPSAMCAQAGSNTCGFAVSGSVGAAPGHAEVPLPVPMPTPAPAPVSAGEVHIGMGSSNFLHELASDVLVHEALGSLRVLQGPTEEALPDRQNSELSEWDQLFFCGVQAELEDMILMGGALGGPSHETPDRNQQLASENTAAASPNTLLRFPTEAREGGGGARALFTTGGGPVAGGACLEGSLPTSNSPHLMLPIAGSSQCHGNSDALQWLAPGEQ